MWDDRVRQHHTALSTNQQHHSQPSAGHPGEKKVLPWVAVGKDQGSPSHFEHVTKLIIMILNSFKGPSE